MPDQSLEQPNLSMHPLVTKPQGDSDTPPGLIALTGYFGPSQKEDTIRLYPSLDFQSYFQIPKGAIVATNPEDASNANSPTVVYVKAGTPVAAVQSPTRPVESYLQGGITGGYIKGTFTGEYVDPFHPPVYNTCPEVQCHSKPTHS